MADPGFPNVHTTRTTVQHSTTTVDATLRYDPSYFRTIPGILKGAQVVCFLYEYFHSKNWKSIILTLFQLLNLLGFICIECSGVYSYATSRGPFFNFVSMTGFWFTGILLALYLFHIIEKYYRIPWLKIEFLFCAIWTGLYLIAASLAVSYPIEAFEAAGVRYRHLIKLFHT